MLGELFGNTNVERVLLFLFVNEKAYATQLQNHFQVPLAPLQNALKKLMSCGVVTSWKEGKARIFTLDQDSPFRWELEALLKKHYTLLSAQEKKCYHYFSSDMLQKKPLFSRELKHFWERLLKVQKLCLCVGSQGKEERGGEAVVTPLLSDARTLIFQEVGEWDKPKSTFRNRFRWSLDLKNTLITLEHLRYGEKRPVFLFHLKPTSEGRLESLDAHLCGEDTYLGSLTWDLEKILFHWRIIGPKKNQQMQYLYI